MTLRIGPFELATPVVLAPMAGITNQAFRRLCREQAGPRGGIYVSEMVTSRALLERNEESLRLIAHDPDEYPRSVQLYGVDPATVGAAVRLLVEEDRTDHVDLNFGCPVPKVTRKGGGAALPWKSALFAQIVSAAVRAAQPFGVPVTVKMRMGIDTEHLTYLEAGRIAEAEGVAAVALHARTAVDYYSGHADLAAIARLKEAVSGIPVLGNGDIWSADDAVRMVERTGCDGVVVGRGCLGRPWLFADLVAAFAGEPERVRPDLGRVLATLRRHTILLAEHYAAAQRSPGGSRGAAGRGGRVRPAEQVRPTQRVRPTGPGDEQVQAEARACRDIRKHIAWYLKGYAVGHEIRLRLAHVQSLAELDDLVAGLDAAQPYPGEAAEGPRGRSGRPRPAVALPDGWLDGRGLDPVTAGTVRAAELAVSGG